MTRVGSLSAKSFLRRNRRPFSILSICPFFIVRIRIEKMPICKITSEVISQVCSLDNKWDTHIHTVYAADDKDILPDLTPQRVIQEAERIGLRGIVFTDHVRTTTSWINQYVNDIHFAAQRTTVQVIIGVEAKINLDGSVDIPSECINGKWWITASVHSFHGDKKAWLSAIYGVLDLPYVTTLGHLGSLYKQDGATLIDFDITTKELAELGRTIAETGKLVEINARHKLPHQSWINAFRQNGVRFCLGSDSHSLSTVGRFSRM